MWVTLQSTIDSLIRGEVCEVRSSENTSFDENKRVRIPVRAINFLQIVNQMSFLMAYIEEDYVQVQIHVQLVVHCLQVKLRNEN